MKFCLLVKSDDQVDGKTSAGHGFIVNFISDLELHQSSLFEK